MKLKFFLCSLCALVLGFVGCNLFNPTGSANIDESDANALTYEGYIKFRANDYDEAARYFSKAIAADSSHSEAWYGLAKTKMNLQEINAFELLKYVNTDSKSALPIAGMSDGMARKYQESVDTVMNFLSKFITYDTTGRLDGVVTYKTVSTNYMLLTAFQLMLALREEMPFIEACQQRNPNTGLPDCNIGDILNGLMGGKGAKALESIHEITSTCAKNPEALGSAITQILPGFSMLTSEGKNTTTSAACDAVAAMTKPSEDPESVEKTLSAVISFSGYSMDVDEDGDGCLDEEVVDGRDNDGDGEIDEDPRDNNPNFVFDEIGMAMNAAYGHRGTSDLMLIKSVAPNDKYRSVDIDMNGIPADDSEWEFVHAKISERNETGDHRFKFAVNLAYNPQGLPFEEFMDIKRKVAKDYRGMYSLEYRKKYIGGCWVHYDEDDYQRNLELQAARYKE